MHFGKYAYGTVAVAYAKANAAAGGTTEVIPAVANKKIRVLSAAFVCGATGTDATFKSATTAITPIFQNASNGGAILPHNPLGWFETVAGEALNVTLGAGTTTGVLVVWVPV